MTQYGPQELNITVPTGAIVCPFYGEDGCQSYWFESKNVSENCKSHCQSNHGISWVMATRLNKRTQKFLKGRKSKTITGTVVIGRKTFRQFVIDPEKYAFIVGLDYFDRYKREKEEEIQHISQKLEGRVKYFSELYVTRSEEFTQLNDKVNTLKRLLKEEQNCTDILKPLLDDAKKELDDCRVKLTENTQKLTEVINESNEHASDLRELQGFVGVQEEELTRRMLRLKFHDTLTSNLVDMIISLPSTSPLRRPILSQLSKEFDTLDEFVEKVIVPSGLSERYVERLADTNMEFLSSKYKPKTTKVVWKADTINSFNELLDEM